MGDFTRLDKFRADLERAKAKRAEWDAKVKELERKCRDEENATIQGIVREAALSPEELAELIRMSMGEKLDVMKAEDFYGKESEEEFDEENN